MNLAAALRARGVGMRRGCGGRGLCGTCVVRVRSGLVREAQTTRVAGDSVRACQSEILSESMAVDVPETPENALRVEDAFVVCRPWPDAGRSPFFTGGAGEVALAVDIGTTTVAVRLFDAAAGALLATQGALNAQTQVADDVLSRIEACARSGMLARQQRLVLDTIEALLERCLARAGVPRARLKGMAVAGNATMAHLFLGIDPSPMGKAPFTPAFEGARTLDGGALLPQWRGVAVRVLPHISAYVGGDIVAGLWAADFFETSGVCAFMDIGTNGEIVVKTPRGLVAASAAAGPAFEGYGLNAGMRANDGAVDRIEIRDGTLSAHVLGGGSPRGLCGSAYLDFLAQARRAGWLLERGRFAPEAGAQTRDGCGRCLDIAARAGFNGGDPVLVCESDIANLLKAKAAVGATLQILCKQAGVALENIDHLFLAGGFGKHIDAANAVACGLLPPVPLSRVRYLGNAALAGATLCALESSAIDKMARAASGVKTVAVNLDDEFEDAFIDAMGIAPLGASD